MLRKIVTMSNLIGSVSKGNKVSLVAISVVTILQLCNYVILFVDINRSLFIINNKILENFIKIYANSLQI